MKHLKNSKPFQVGDVAWYVDSARFGDGFVIAQARVHEQWLEVPEYDEGEENPRWLSLSDHNRKMSASYLSTIPATEAWHTLNEAQLALANRLRREAFQMRLKANDNIRRAKLFEKDARIGEPEQLADWQESHGVEITDYHGGKEYLET